MIYKNTAWFAKRFFTDPVKSLDIYRFFTAIRFTEKSGSDSKTVFEKTASVCIADFEFIRKINRKSPSLTRGGKY